MVRIYVPGALPSAALSEFAPAALLPRFGDGLRQFRAGRRRIDAVLVPMPAIIGKQVDVFRASNREPLAAWFRFLGLFAEDRDPAGRKREIPPARRSRESASCAGAA